MLTGNEFEILGAENGKAQPNRGAGSVMKLVEPTGREVGK